MNTLMREQEVVVSGLGPAGGVSYPLCVVSVSKFSVMTDEDSA